MKSAAAKMPEASRSGFGQRLKRSLPDPVEAFVGGAVWAAAMAASAFVAILMQEWETSAKIQSIAVLFALGGALSFPLALLAARFLSLGRSGEAAFAAAFFSFAAVTVSVTGLIFAFDYRTYYSEWHADAGSITWVFQLVFTTLAALYQFAVLGVRLLFPVGFIALFAVSLWFARMPR
ncbi:hypothetical protein SAMN04488498_105297 [Mesorhizobium albiziae]|uniref:Uncharacterized protein n=2 Tax=Neomesorhizobium albiziae TaxID=335020 RepID=A0A1I3Z0P3_9HYPH|nr:hypothetical protein GCM10007937_48650 [Mesorhizobium albiziae]SFK37618.1 hypothetical protein SAMN04488498_105297 [Mesorhizobium albiziae]